MQRYAMVIRVRPEKLAYYRKLHAEPWPGVIAALKKANVQNYSIYLRGDTLFGYLEYTGDDYEADMAKVAEDETTQQWWRETDPCQQPMPDAAEGEWWSPLEEVFHMD